MVLDSSGQNGHLGWDLRSELYDNRLSASFGELRHHLKAILWQIDYPKGKLEKKCQSDSSLGLKANIM